MHLRLLLFAAIAAPTLAGCNPCAERCRVLSVEYDGCLFEWGLEWADLDAADRVDWRQACVADEAILDAGRSAEARQVEHGLCADLVAGVRGASTCDEVWEALVQYGAEP